MSELISKKVIADELAHLIHDLSDDTLRMNNLAGKLSVSLNPENQHRPDELCNNKETNDVMVGVWKQEFRNGEPYFVRDPKMKADWTFWSQTPVIQPKSDKKRIAFLGESVARGYLYDPYYIPANVLEQVINHSGFIDCEVIDLARTNLDLTGLDKLSDECLNINPDGIVIFAGNNWFYSIKRELNKEDILLMGNALEEAGLEGLKNFLLKKFKLAVIKYLEHLSKIVNSKNIPIWFVIPEFNLLDWKSSENERIPTSLPNEKLREWTLAMQYAESALEENDLDAVYSLGCELVKIDCSHPSGYEIIAESILRRKINAEDAREYLEAARDTSIFTRAYSKPRSFDIVRKTFLNEAEKYNIKIIDLPTIFSAHKNGELPGRDLFLDYCHMSEEGIQISMGTVAKELINYFGGKQVSLKELHIEDFTAAADVKAVAYLCAAVHSAHYGQKHDVLNYLCDTAAKASPLATDIMSNFVDFASRKAINTLCRSHEKVVEGEYINQYGGGVGFLNKKDQKIMDLALVGAMTEALKKTGVNLDEKVAHIRKQDHGVNGKRIELTESFYSSSAYDIYTGKMPGYFQTRNARSEFFLIATEESAVNLKLTYRTPNRESADRVKIYINNIFLMEVPTTEQWKTQSLIIMPDKLMDGLNIIEIVWSDKFDFKKNTKQVDLSEDYVLNKLYNVYGEILSFSAYAD